MAVRHLSTRELADLAAEVIRQAQAQVMPRAHLTEDELADRLNLSVEAVKQWRKQDRGPAYIKGDGRQATVRYRVKDVEAWEESHLVRHDQPA